MESANDRANVGPNNDTKREYELHMLILFPTYVDHYLLLIEITVNCICRSLFPAFVDH